MKIDISKIKLNINKKKLVLLCINIILVVAFIILSIFAKKGIRMLYSQQEARRWEDEKNSYAQVSAFTSPDRNLQEEDIASIRSSVMETLSKDSLNESSGASRVWIDAYSGECKAEFRKDNNTLSVTAVGVGGEFFQFHPIPLLSGSYISDEDLNQDRVVVDENFAWAMFGSNDIVGMQIWLGNSIYTIAGVTAVDENTLYRTAYGDSNRIYMPARGIEEENEEVIKKTENPLDFEDIQVMENSNRFDTMKLLEGLKNRKLQVMRPNSVGYPVWENLARVEVQRQQNLLVLRLLLLICPFVCLVLWLYGLWKRRTWTVKSICGNTIERIRQKREERAEEERRRLAILEAESHEEDEDSEDYPESDGECLPDEEEPSDEEEELQSVTSEDIFHI